MNYMLEIKAFYDWLETNPLPTPAIAVWHALMHTANKTGWQQEFAVAVSVLVIKTGLNAKAIERARNKLAQDGRIEWKKRGGNQSANYHMISLLDKTSIEDVAQPVAQPVAQSVAQPVAQSVAQPVAINKLNETKLDIKKTLAKKEEAVVSEKYFENEKLNETFLEFIKMRKSIKSAMTDRAIELMIKKLSKYDLETQIAMLEQSIINSWKDVYEPKEKAKKVISPNKFHNFEQRTNDLDTLMNQINGGNSHVCKQ